MRGKRIGVRAALALLVAALASSLPAAAAASDEQLWRGLNRGPRLDARRDPGEGEGRGPGQPRHLGWLCGQVLGRRVHQADRLQGQHEGRRQSDDMVDLVRPGAYDGVSASGDATSRLIARGDVAPVNFDLTPNYADVFEGLKNQSYNTVDGVGYGVPHGRGANLDGLETTTCRRTTTAGRRSGPGPTTRASCRSTTARSSSPTPPSISRRRSRTSTSRTRTSSTRTSSTLRSTC